MSVKENAITANGYIIEACDKTLSSYNQTTGEERDRRFHEIRHLANLACKYCVCRDKCEARDRLYVSLGKTFPDELKKTGIKRVWESVDISQIDPEETVKNTKRLLQYHQWLKNNDATEKMVPCGSAATKEMVFESEIDKKVPVDYGGEPYGTRFIREFGMDRSSYYEKYNVVDDTDM